ncbi:uncharacterized protein EV422DRAFT_330115 [Fimicolochytrium jonesii]|uniref:uncharacterized protein n=1 Tax=Fimicolochytrium jonesii TaxID=1396493 RepID=UPI0022FEFB04|nr:uncharacterized protein EV422DRAFT_330115 [Fimicolochytrium jonesii]KAI8816197.1 hypothetical protein EV422DRAFT_330115 [Fimicolochytrium jonesii]
MMAAVAPFRDELSHSGFAGHRRQSYHAQQTETSVTHIKNLIRLRSNDDSIIDQQTSASLEICTFDNLAFSQSTTENLRDLIDNYVGLQQSLGLIMTSDQENSFLRPKRSGDEMNEQRGLHESYASRQDTSTCSYETAVVVERAAPMAKRRRISGVAPQSLAAVISPQQTPANIPSSPSVNENVPFALGTPPNTPLFVGDQILTDIKKLSGTRSQSPRRTTGRSPKKNRWNPLELRLLPNGRQCPTAATEQFSMTNRSNPLQLRLLPNGREVALQTTEDCSPSCSPVKIVKSESTEGSNQDSLRKYYEGSNLSMPISSTPTDVFVDGGRRFSSNTTPAEWSGSGTKPSCLAACQNPLLHECNQTRMLAYPQCTRIGSGRLSTDASCTPHCTEGGPRQRKTVAALGSVSPGSYDNSSRAQVDCTLFVSTAARVCSNGENTRQSLPLGVEEVISLHGVNPSAPISGGSSLIGGWAESESRTRHQFDGTLVEAPGGLFDTWASSDLAKKEEGSDIDAAFDWESDDSKRSNEEIRYQPHPRGAPPRCTNTRRSNENVPSIPASSGAVPQVKYHKSEQGFHCPFEGCNMITDRKFNCHTHFLTHYGVRPFSCDKCDGKVSLSEPYYFGTIINHF